MVPVFADVDTGVDDALGLIYLLASEDAEIVGIASTAGNVSVDYVCANNLGLLELCKAPQIPVSKGVAEPLSAALRTAEDTHGPTGLGYALLPESTRTLTDYDSAEAWVKAAHAYPGELVGLATGPLTNLALALRTEPELPKLLKRLVIMGGSFDYPGNTTPVAEWNVVVDPGATAEVYAAWGAAGVQELPIVCGLNLTETIAMTPEHLVRLADAAGATTTPLSVLDSPSSRSGASNSVLRFIEDAAHFYFEFHMKQGEGFLAHMHDPFAAAVALDPSLVQTRSATVDVELTGDLTRAMTIADWKGQWGQRPNAQIAVETDPEVFFQRFIERVSVFARTVDDAR